MDFLDGLSQDELECLADFFDPRVSERWQNPADRAHKTFVVLAWLDKLDCPAPLRLVPQPH